eukprot:g9820.t1
MSLSMWAMRATERVCRNLLRRPAEGLWEGKWYGCRPREAGALMSVTWEEPHGELLPKDLRGGCLLFRSLAQLERAKLLRSAEEPGAASPAVFLALAPDKTSQEALFRSLRPFEKELEGPKEQREGLFHMTLMQVRHWNSTIHSAVNELWSQHNAKLGAIRLEKANLKREGPPLAGQ